MNCLSGCFKGRKRSSKREAQYQAKDNSSELSEKFCIELVLHEAESTDTGSNQCVVNTSKTQTAGHQSTTETHNNNTNQNASGTLGVEANDSGGHGGGTSRSPGGASGDGVSNNLQKPEKNLKYISSRENLKEFRELLPSSVLSFNPKTSSGLFIGVGCQESTFSNDLGRSPVNDCKRMQKLAINRLGIQESSTQCLSSERRKNGSIEESLPNATHTVTILNQIETVANKADSDGIFMLHFSCHGHRMQLYYPGIKVPYDGILIPYDFNMEACRFIKYEMILDALKNCRAKAVLITLDGCHVLSITKELCRAATHPPLYVYAACRETERSVNWPQLGHGVFTYVAANYIEEHGKQGFLPAQSLQDHLSSCFHALNNLHEEGNIKGVTEMHPEVVLSGRVPRPSAQTQSDPVSKESPEQQNLTPQSTPMSPDKMLDYIRESVLKVDISDDIDIKRIKDFASNLLKTKADFCMRSSHGKKLKALLTDKGFQIHCLAYTTYSLVMHLVRGEGITIKELTSVRVVHELWECFAEKLPILLRDSMTNYQDAYAFFYSFRRRLEIHCEEEKLPDEIHEVHKLEKLFDFCKKASEIYKIHYDGARGSESEDDDDDELLETPNLDCAIPTISVPELDDDLLHKLKSL